MTDYEKRAREFLRNTYHDVCTSVDGVAAGMLATLLATVAREAREEERKACEAIARLAAERASSTRDGYTEQCFARDKYSSIVEGVERVASAIAARGRGK
jgi:hypothetical protein